MITRGGLEHDHQGGLEHDHQSSLYPLVEVQQRTEGYVGYSLQESDVAGWAPVSIVHHHSQGISS